MSYEFEESTESIVSYELRVMSLKNRRSQLSRHCERSEAIH